MACHQGVYRMTAFFILMFFFWGGGNAGIFFVFKTKPSSACVPGG